MTARRARGKFSVTAACAFRLIPRLRGPPHSHCFHSCGIKEPVQGPLMLFAPHLVLTRLKVEERPFKPVALLEVQPAIPPASLTPTADLPAMLPAAQLEAPPAVPAAIPPAAPPAETTESSPVGTTVIIPGGPTIWVPPGRTRHRTIAGAKRYFLRLNRDGTLRTFTMRDICKFIRLLLRIVSAKILKIGQKSESSTQRTFALRSKGGM